MEKEKTKNYFAATMLNFDDTVYDSIIPKVLTVL